MEDTIGLNATIINQPIAKYISVDTSLNLPAENVLNIIPPIARPQIIPNIDHPQGPLSGTSVNGVYVPAMSRYIEE